MTKSKVLIPIGKGTDLQDHLDEFKQFTKEFDVIIREYTDLEALIKDLENDLSDISAIYETSASFKLGGFNKLIPHLPTSLKVVAFPWVGANGFDHEALRSKNIDLANVGEVSAYDVADIALSLTLSTFRYTSLFERSLRTAQGNITEARKIIGSKEFDRDNGNPIPLEKPASWAKELYVANNPLESPRGKTAGIVGLGFIGKQIAIRLNAIGLNIKYTKRTPLTQEESDKLPFDLDYVKSFEELLPQVDLLVLAVPHTPQTVELINKNSLKLAKKGLRIVNIGRGSAINEDDLFEALDNGTINSVGLDVFLNEPQIDKRFLNRPNVTVLPHLGSFTQDNFKQATIATLNNIKNVLNGDLEKVNIVN